MAARVFKVDELAAQIATRLLAISPRSTVSFALACKVLEIPALMALWGTECSLVSLISRVLSPNAWRASEQRHCDIYLHVGPPFLSGQHPVYSSAMKNTQALRRPLTTRELNRLKRYASWIRRLEVREGGSLRGAHSACPSHVEWVPSRLASSLAGIDLVAQ